MSRFLTPTVGVSLDLYVAVAGLGGLRAFGTVATGLIIVSSTA